jgi:hypothetical protein
MSAARSAQINFANRTSQTLVLPPNGATLSGGEWSPELMPPSSISANSEVTWQSESDGFLTGTQGTAVYVFQGAGTTISVIVSWDNPYDGSSTYSAVVNPQSSGYQAQGSTPDNDADNATFNVQLTGF